MPLAVLIEYCKVNIYTGFSFASTWLCILHVHCSQLSWMEQKHLFFLTFLYIPSPSK